MERTFASKPDARKKHLTQSEGSLPAVLNAGGMQGATAGMPLFLQRAAMDEEAVEAEESDEQDQVLQQAPLEPGLDEEEQRPPNEPDELIQQAPLEPGLNEEPASAIEPEESDESEETEEPPIQAKLLIGEPGDAYEQEADQVAQTVTQPSAEPPTISRAAIEGDRLQRLCTSCEQEQRETRQTSEDEEGQLQRQSTDSDPDLPRLPHKLTLPDAGFPLPSHVLSRVEPTLGADLSHVRVHASPSAQQTAKDLKAKAFTHNHHIWLGPGQSADDVNLMAHEATHVVQQTSTPGLVQRIQRRPADYRHPEDGGGVQSRLDQRFREEIPDAETEPSAGASESTQRSAPKIDPAEKQARSAELRGDTHPDVDRPAQEQPKVEQSASVVEQEAASPPEQLVEGEQATEPQADQESGQEAQSAAEQAAGLAEQAFAAASAQPEPPTPTEVQPAQMVTPVDAAGEALEPDPDADAAIGDMGDRIQYLRQRGTLMQAQAAEGHANAEIIRGNIARVSSEIGKAEQGITTAQSHAQYRHETIGQAEQALGVSEEKQATVAAGAPDYQSKADEGKEDSGPMASEASSVVAENASNTPDDPEAAEKAQEQGGQINQVSSGATTMDSAITNTRSRADSLAADAARAAQVNTQTRGTITSGQQQLDQTDQRLTQHQAEASQARAQVDGLASAPDEAHAQADQLNAQGEQVIASSMQLEERMHQAQQNYAASTQAIPPLKPWDGEMPEGAEASAEAGAEAGTETEAGAIAEAGTESEETAIQMEPDENQTTPSGAATPSSGTTAVAEPPPSTPPISSAPTATPTATSGTIPESTATTGLAPGASEAAATPTSETAPPETETAPESAEGEGEAEAGAAEEGANAPEGEAGAPTEDAATSLEPEIVLGPRQEQAHLESEVPAWLTGADPESVRGREEAQRQANGRRREEVNWINEQLQGQSVAQIGAGERFSLVGRALSRRFQGIIGNIRWPGWGGLAKMLLDPRSLLAGAVGGLGMILSGASNLFSLQQWQRDPLGNLLTSAANIATGIAVILGSITALAGLVIAILGALILLSFGALAVPFAPIITFCTTVITTVGGWAIAAGKIALVLQALALIKNLIDVATAQTADELQRETEEISGNINGSFQAVMSIVGAKGAQAGLSRLSSRISRVTAARTAAGGSRALARQTFRAAPGAIRAAGRRAIRRVRVAPRRLARGGQRLASSLLAAPRNIAAGVRQRLTSLRDRIRSRFAREGGVVRSRPMPGGHELKVTRSGRVFHCSECVLAHNDVDYTRSRHTLEGSQVQRDLRRGREAHVFNEDVDLADLERRVWTQGQHQGTERGWDRFVYRSDTPIGRRVQAGRPDVPLYVVEIKGRLRNGQWEYHLVPRTRPAAPSGVGIVTGEAGAVGNATPSVASSAVPEVTPSTPSAVTGSVATEVAEHTPGPPAGTAVSHAAGESAETTARGTAWEAIASEGPAVGRTPIPRHFELNAGGSEFWVHPNATKHMHEFVMRGEPLPAQVRLRSQLLLDEFRSAVAEAAQRGIRYGQVIHVGKWELIFTMRPGDRLPVIKHAVYRP